MDKKGQGLGMVGIAIMAIIGVVILGVVFSFLQDNALSSQTQSDSITVDEASLSAGTQIALTYDDIINNTVTLDNGTITINAGNYTVYPDTGYISVYNNTGAKWNDTEAYGATLNVNYTYYPDGYLTGSTNRTLMAIVPVILAIVLLLGIIGYNVLRG